MKFILEEIDEHRYYKISPGNIYKFVVNKSHSSRFIYDDNFISIVLDAKKFGRHGGYFLIINSKLHFTSIISSIFDPMFYQTYRMEKE